MKQIFFLKFSCFFYDPEDVGNLISGSSVFSKSSLYIWKFSVYTLLKHSLNNFEYYIASMWNKWNSEVVWTFFGIVQNTVAAKLLSRFSCVRLCATPETAAHQAPPSLGFSRQEYWSGLPFPSPQHSRLPKNEWVSCWAGHPSWVQSLLGPPEGASTQHMGLREPESMWPKSACFPVAV